jgi:OmpA-OmpF porin, OOP family
MTYVSGASDASCGALNSRVVAFTVIVEPNAREQRMVTLSSTEMRQGITSQGHVALYGINFDFDKTDIRPDSRPQLDEIGKLLKDDPGLKLFVIGHTDDKGTPAYNLDLSRRRADAVAAALAKDLRVNKARLAAYGVGQLAPVAPNATDEGRAKNRRVELVPQ